MIQTLFIRGVLPSLNKLSKAAVFTTKRGKKITKYGQAKKTLTGRVAVVARARKLEPVPYAYFTFLHVCTDKRTDPDNFCGVAQKVTLDGLKQAKIIVNDGWAQVSGLAHYWSVGDEPGFWVVMSGGPLSAGEAWDAVGRKAA